MTLRTNMTESAKTKYAEYAHTAFLVQKKLKNMKETPNVYLVPCLPTAGRPASKFEICIILSIC